MTPYSGRLGSCASTIRMRGSPEGTTLPYLPRSRSGSSRAPSGELRIGQRRSEEHTSELQSLMRISYAVFCLKKKTKLRSLLYQEKTNNNSLYHDHKP